MKCVFLRQDEQKDYNWDELMNVLHVQWKPKFSYFNLTLDSDYRNQRREDEPASTNKWKDIVADLREKSWRRRVTSVRRLSRKRH